MTDEEILWWYREFEKLPGYSEDERIGGVMAALGNVEASRIRELVEND